MTDSLRSRHLITKLMAAVFLTALSCSRPDTDFAYDELRLIHSTDSIMRVLTIKDSLDLKVLRAPSTRLSEKALLSEDFARLSSLMLATVQHPSQDGVGIAAPQIGINRRVIAVQRFDKEPHFPFEVYANVSIVWASDSLALGPEGCLSVPELRGNVLRSKEIVVEYTGLSAGLPTVRDTISGFTAVIFQHEIDHLDGILYIDR